MIWYVWCLGRIVVVENNLRVGVGKNNFNWNSMSAIVN